MRLELARRSPWRWVSPHTGHSDSHLPVVARIDCSPPASYTFTYHTGNSRPPSGDLIPVWVWAGGRARDCVILSIVIITGRWCRTEGRRAECLSLENIVSLFNIPPASHLAGKINTCPRIMMMITVHMSRLPLVIICQHPHTASRGHGIPHHLECWHAPLTTNRGNMAKYDTQKYSE